MSVEVNAQVMEKKTHQIRKPMKTSDLRANRPVFRLQVVMVRCYPARMIITPQFTGMVAAACGRDEHGLVGIVLWGDQTHEVKLGNIIQINSGWCRLRDGQLVVSTGKYGHLEILD